MNMNNNPLHGSSPSASRSPGIYSMPGKIEVVSPQTLRPHWQNEQLFRSVSGAKDDEFVEHVRQHGVRRPLIVTGVGCESAPNTILSGHRRWHAAFKLGLAQIEVIKRDGLSARDELEIMVLDNLGDQHGRRLSTTQKAELERMLFEKYRIGQGARTDLKTSVTGNQGSVTTSTSQRTALARIAAETGCSQSTIAARQKAVHSPLSTPKLKAALDAGQIKENPAARIVRTIEKDAGVRAALKAQAQGALTLQMAAVLDAARRQVDEQLDTLVSKPKRQRRRKDAEKSGVSQVHVPQVLEPVDKPDRLRPNDVIYVDAPDGIHRELTRLCTRFVEVAQRYPQVGARYLGALITGALRAINIEAEAVLEAMQDATGTSSPTGRQT